MAVRFYIHDHEGIKPDGARCRVSATRCDAVLVGNTVIDGALTGAGAYTLYATPRSDGNVDYDGEERFVGAIAGCGRGAMTFRIKDGVVDFRHSDVATHSNVDRENWSIVAGSGTDGLEGISGSGSDVLTDHQDTTTDGIGTGTVVCHDRGRSLPASRPAAAPKQATTTTEVHGAFVNDDLCGPGHSFAPHADDPTTFDFSCGIASVYSGGLDGHTLGNMTGTIDVSGNTVGTYDEWFYGTLSSEDGTLGGIHYQGWFAVDGKTNGFRGGAKIVGGTCSFAGAAGAFAFSGISVAGGWSMQLVRPEPKPAPSATCDPVDPNPVIVP